MQNLLIGDRSEELGDGGIKHVYRSVERAERFKINQKKSQEVLKALIDINFCQKKAISIKSISNSKSNQKPKKNLSHDRVPSNLESNIYFHTKSLLKKKSLVYSENFSQSTDSKQGGSRSKQRDSHRKGS